MKKLITLNSLFLTILIGCQTDINPDKYIMPGQNKCTKDCGKVEEELVLKPQPTWTERTLNEKNVCLPSINFSVISSIYLDKECKTFGLWIKQTCGKEITLKQDDQFFVYMWDHKKENNEDACSDSLYGAIAEVSFLESYQFYYKNIEQNNECVPGPPIRNSYLAKQIDFVYREENFPESCDINENTQQH